MPTKKEWEVEVVIRKKPELSDTIRVVISAWMDEDAETAYIEYRYSEIAREMMWKNPRDLEYYQWYKRALEDRLSFMRSERNRK